MNSHDSLNINIYRKMNPDLANLINDELNLSFMKNLVLMRTEYQI